MDLFDHFFPNNGRKGWWQKGDTYIHRKYLIMITQKYLDDLTYEIIGASIEVQKNIGKGLLESVYHKCMEKELLHRGIYFQTEMIIPIQYKDFEIDANLRCDLFIENCNC